MVRYNSGYKSVSLVVSVQAWQVMDWGREFQTTKKPLLLPYVQNIVIVLCVHWDHFKWYNNLSGSRRR